MHPDPALVAEIPAPDGSPVCIRPAIPDDAAAVLVHLHTAGGETPYLSFGAEGPGRDEAGQRALLAGLCDSDNGLALVAVRDGEVVACLTFQRGGRARTRHVGEFGISVARACWGLGVGRRMIEMLLTWAERGGTVRKVNLRVRADNARGIALYESLGFVHEGRLARDNCVDGVFHDALLMGRAVDPSSTG